MDWSRVTDHLLLPRTASCSACEARFDVSDASDTFVYSLAGIPNQSTVDGAPYAPVPRRVAWCYRCNQLAFSELIMPFRAYEVAYGLLLSNIRPPYPFDEIESPDVAKRLVHWRAARKTPPRCLACGATDFAAPADGTRLLHSNCDGELAFSTLVFVGSCTVSTPEETRTWVFSAEGDLTAAAYREGANKNQIFPAAFARPALGYR